MQRSTHTQRVNNDAHNYKTAYTNTQPHLVVME